MNVQTTFRWDYIYSLYLWRDYPVRDLSEHFFNKVPLVDNEEVSHRFCEMKCYADTRGFKTIIALCNPFVNYWLRAQNEDIFTQVAISIRKSGRSFIRQFRTPFNRKDRRVPAGQKNQL
jgi:hypothetical protein